MTVEQVDKKELEQMWKDGKISFRNYRFFAEKMLKPNSNIVVFRRERDKK